MTDEPKAAGFQFECTLCGEESFGVPTRVNRKCQYVVDEECAVDGIVPMLLAALANEFSYPPLWGDVVIESKRFLHFLPEDFAEKYSEKRKEYRTPLALRIYCRNKLIKGTAGLREECNTFVGQKVNAPAQGPELKWIECRFCSTRCCNKCGAIVMPVDRWRTVLHRCAAPKRDDTSAFDGLTRGVHYQICPGCGMRVELAEACNALQCLGHPCRASFCAICGFRAEHDSDHWQLGKPCPRWNKPTDANAGFDPAPVAVEPVRNEVWVAAEHLMITEMEDWRRRSWNTVPVRDEKHTIWLLHVSNLTAEETAMERDEAVLRHFNSELEANLEAYFREVGINAGLPHARGRVEEMYRRLEDEENLALLRHLLLLHKDALQVLPLHRGVGQYLTKDHLRRLQVSYVCKYFSMAALWEAIGDHFMLDYPRFVDTLQRTIDELEWLIIDIREELDETEDEVPELDAGDQLEVPVVEDSPKLWENSHKVYKALEGMRLDMIELGMVRPPRLGAAIDMFWLQYSSLQIPKRFREAASIREKHRLMIEFMANDQEIEERREEMRTDRWPEEMRRPNTELWESTMEGYTKLAEQFKKLIPTAVLINYQRGWLG
jgi:hypothetical protein